jgi:hypothetical protein
MARYKDIRWTTSDRGLRYYQEVDGREVHESSAAESPHLWIDGEHVDMDEAFAMRDAEPQGRWRDTLTAAILGHYQLREAPKDWKAGDQCVLCGSFDTTLESNVAGCNGCGAKEES